MTVRPLISSIFSPIFRPINEIGGGEFNPATVSGLKQFLFSKTALSGSTIFDERTNKGSARPIQLGRCYEFDGTNDLVDYGSTGFSFLENASLAWSAEVYFNATSVVGIRRIFTKQTAGAFKGTGIYLNGASLRFDLVNGIAVQQLTVSVNGFTPVAGTNYKVKMMYNGNKLATGVTWEINGVAYTSTIVTQTLTVDDVLGATSLRMGTDGSLANVFAGKIWGLKLWNAAGVLQLFPKCDEQQGTISYDSSGFARHGTITNATLSTFHSTQNLISYQNDIGYRFNRNFWLQTEMFGTSPWTIQGATVSSMTKTAPDGTATADEITEDSSTGNHRFFQATAFVTGSIYTVSIYLKYVARRYVAVNHAGASTTVVYDLQNGVISGSNGTIIASGMEDAGNGWYRCWHTSASTTTGNASSIVYGSTTGTGIGTGSYTGLNGIAFEAWGSQIELGSLTAYHKNVSATALSFIPRNEAIPTQDVLGNALEFVNEVPYNALLKASGCSVVNGTTSYWNVPDNPIFDITNNLSVIIKAKNSSTIGAYSEHLITKWTETGNFREWVIGVNLTQKPYVALSSNGAAVAVYTATNAVTVSDETTYGFTFSSGTVKLYVNGVLVAGSVTTGSIPASLYNGTSPIAIGSVFASGSVNWKGNLWDARIYKDAVLTDAEMLAIHNGTDTTVGATPVAHFPMAETAGNIIYNAVVDVHGTGVNSPTRSTQNLYHYNITEGYSRYDHASSADILVPYSSAGIPLVITPPSGYTKITDNPAGVAGNAFRNSAETLVDETGGVASPIAVILGWSNAKAFGTAETNPEFERLTTLASANYQSDRSVKYLTTLSGTDLTKVQNFTATRAI